MIYDYAGVYVKKHLEGKKGVKRCYAYGVVIAKLDDQ